MLVKNKDLYQWQKDYINHEGNTTMKGGRQIGKSMTTAKRILHLANKYPGEIHLILAASERQENYLLDKLKGELGANFKYRKRTTNTLLPLPNGTDIFKYPVGRTGIYVEGLSNVAFIWIDEAIHLGEKVYDSIIPMIAEPRKRGLGWLNYLSATKGKAKGLFFESFRDKKFHKVSEKAEDQPHISKEFLKEELERLGPERYGVIYNGDFSENATKYFPREIVERAATFAVWTYKHNYNVKGNWYLGVDPAGMGRSEAAWVSAEQYKDRVRVPHYETMRKSSMQEMLAKTRELNIKFKYKKMFIDPRGLGQGYADFLEDEFKGRVRRLDNSAAGIHGKVLKEDLYSNALRLFALKKIDILHDQKLIDDLCAVETDDDDKIIGTDVSEAFVRAVFCDREKSYKVKMHSF